MPRKSKSKSKSRCGKGYCSICKEENKLDILLKCSHENCPNRFYHTRCMRPPVHSAPPANAKWVCPSCLCRVCFVLKDHHLSVLCNDCNDCYHIYCLDISIAELPKGDWLCPSCQEMQGQSQPSSSKTN
ncbi:hypothetical protein SUGI_0246900 [Cryptomeria japonica]|nr:hypothetical protein SUGI_0246900 [Cryptomeria japonica]